MESLVRILITRTYTYNPMYYQNIDDNLHHTYDYLSLVVGAKTKNVDLHIQYTI